MTDRDALVAGFESILKDLLRGARASRTTLRIDLPAFGLGVNLPAAEALAPGVPSLKDKASLDQRRSVAFRWLDKHRRLFIEDDCLTAEPDVAPEREVVEVYGIRSEMLGPLVRDDRLVGVVSVHDTTGPRQWTKDEIAALERACAAFQRELDRIGGR
jgi:maleate isomerase